VTRLTSHAQGDVQRIWRRRVRAGLIVGVSSSYRFSGPFVVRLLGTGLVAVGLVVVVLVALVAALHLPEVALAVVLVAAAVVVVGLGVTAVRHAAVVRFDEAGYRIRFIRGAGVRQARWTQVEDVVASTVAGTRCVVLQLRDGRTSTVPVSALATSSEAFVDDLREHLNRGHGYRPLPRARS